MCNRCTREDEGFFDLAQLECHRCVARGVRLCEYGALEADLEEKKQVRFCFVQHLYFSPFSNSTFKFRNLLAPHKDNVFEDRHLPSLSVPRRSKNDRCERKG
jgi:hypothetical protein